MTSRTRSGLGAIMIALAAICLPGATGEAGAQNLQPVSVIVFPGGFNWPIWIAQEKGYFARGAIESREIGVSRFTYEPGARMPWGHRHREQEEVYVVVAGSGRAKLDEEIIEVGAWGVLRVAPAVVRSFEAGPDGMDVICIGGRKPDGPDSERHPDPWS